MRILIITRSFAPDSTIASKRPTKFAKYLCKMGHDVCVVRSGQICGKVDITNLRGLQNVKIFSYEGKDSPAEQIERRDCLQKTKNNVKKPSQQKYSKEVLKKARRIIKTFVDPVRYYKNDGLSIYKKIKRMYEGEPLLHGYDVIISSFGPLGCVLAGEYISKCENAKWIIDFRDLMNNQNFSPIIRKINYKIQNSLIKKADICLCVSDGNTKRLQALNNGRFSEKIYTLYNGYEYEPKEPVTKNDKNSMEVHICYTGTLHNGARNARPLFHALKKINSPINVKIDYAGRDFIILKEQAAESGMEDIVIDHGYLSSTEVADLQEKADIFLVLSWNTKLDTGILTGKFYEALQHKKPIVALIDGDRPNSELKLLIDRYHLGVCYEESTKEVSEYILQNYINKQLSMKMQGKELEYKPEKTVFTKFEYSTIVKKLEKIIKE